MKKIYFLWVLLLAVFLPGCSEEAALEPSGLGRNWFVIQDKPGELNQLIYSIYKETGIPILVNDTLGKEERGVDIYGNPVIHYERFVIGYSVEMRRENARLVLSSDTAAMILTVKALRDMVIPRLPADLVKRPYCFLIGDSLHMTEYGYSAQTQRSGESTHAYRDMMGVVVGKVSDMKKMSERERKWWAGMVLAINLGTAVYADSPDDMTKFYNVSLKSGTVTYHSANATYNLSSGKKSTNPNYDWEPQEMGFLEYTVNGILLATSGVLNKRCPSREIDATNYIAAVYAWTQEEFAALYGNWPKCLEKYRIMKEIMDRYEAMTGNK